MVAVGTSIPELATSVIAALKKQTGISLGNIIGSNVMNILSVLGITGLITPIHIEKALVYFDIPWMLGTGLVLLILIVIPSRFILNRWKGVIMVVVYLLYLYLIF
jgi:cation:H+ antiporter